MKYALTIKLIKHKDARPMIYHYTAKEGEDIQGIKESVCMMLENTFGTPCKCVKVVEEGS